MERVTSSSRRRSNAAAGLRDIGRPAIPRLINLLRDRRRIRAVGFWRVFHPSRTVLRYQDVAIEILQELIPKRIYARSTTAAPERRDELPWTMGADAASSSRWYGPPLTERGSLTTEDPAPVPNPAQGVSTMGARFVLLMLFNIAAVFLCVVATLQIYDPMSRVSQALGVVLMVLTTLPIGWIMWVSPHPESTVGGIVLLNAPLWAYCIEWLLQRFVDRRKGDDPG
ncbi:hypothetical protein [Planctomyces sp. SH-PL14]|uniref:hypothetical protein n=1 Tax=Planctomyces sp. SH-PL14 TaxID=1632864 RepID=UPI00094636D2|nr:hypothetical protein [Planctomyces sp. SH-PL14]